MLQLEERIKEIKIKIEKAKNQRYKAEARLDTLVREENDLLTELQELGVEPDQLSHEIERLEEEIEQELQEIRKLLPQELLS